MLLAHLAYSLTSYVAIKNGRALSCIARATTVLDASVAMSVALVTEGTSSPSFVFFVCIDCYDLAIKPAICACSNDVRGCGLHIGNSLRAHSASASYLARTEYLAITACLVGYFGLRRGEVEPSGRQKSEQRQALDAADVREDYVQMLAGVNLWLQACQGMLRSGKAEATLAQLTDLQISIAREYDQVRDLMLKGRDAAAQSSYEL